MPQQSTIEWTDATWNPVTGCSKVSPGCKNCYAEAYFARPYPGRKFTDVRIHPERLDWPLRWRGSPKAKAEGRPSRIFVNSMSDLFHEEVPFVFVRNIFNAMEPREERPNFIFQVLTKRPQRMKVFFEHCWTDTDGEATKVLSNVWIGVSVEDQKTADERIPLLLQTPAAVRWVSYEPALGPVDFTQIGDDGINALIGRQPHWHHDPDGEMWNPGKLDWIVAGGESGPRARPPHPDWFRSVRDQCAAVGVPFFFKQWGAWAPLESFESDAEWQSCYAHAMVRAEDGFFRSVAGPDNPDPEFGLTCADLDGNDGFASMGMRSKKKSGRLLDGREHNGFPEIQGG